MEILIIIVITSIILAIIIKLIKNIKIIYITEQQTNIEKLYSKKKLMTKSEEYFYKILIELENELNIKIHPQVNLATIIKKNANNKYINELFKNIDFGVFSKDYSELLLLIEINDSSHDRIERRTRDEKVNKIVQSANIKLIKFYTKYSNKPEYVKNRIKEELKMGRY